MKEKVGIFKPEYLRFSIVLFVLGLMNVFGNYSIIISLLSSFLSYAFVFHPLIKNKNFERSFVYFIACLAITFDETIFVYGQDKEVGHFSFLALPVLGAYLANFIAIIYFIVFYKKWGASIFHQSPEKKRILKYILIFLVTGTLTIGFCMLVNDNMMMNTGYYPKHAILTIYRFICRSCILLSAIILCSNARWKKLCSDYLQLILIVVVFVSIVAALLGFNGYYAANKIMLAPLSFTFTPMLLIFSLKRLNSPFRKLSLIAALLAIVFSFIYGGVAMGSKWYLFILGAVVGIIFIVLRVKSIWTMIGYVIIGLLLLPLLAIPISRMSSGNDYVGWKLTQAFNTINVFGGGGVSDWYDSMDLSPLFRIEEMQCIMIEYYYKPAYILFGKGLSGTTRHYTNILVWEDGDGGFPPEQQKLGAYSSMHESLLTIILAHGLCGIIFLFSTMGVLLRRAYITPWALIGAFWLFLFWDYSYSMIIGALGVALALCENIPKKLKV